MIEFLKTWVSKSEHFDNEQDGTLVEVISELLLEAASIDGKIDDKEIEESKYAICSFFDISEEQATKIIQKLHDKAGQKNEFHSLTKQIRDECDYDERMYILSMLWQIVLADDQIDSLESNLMRRLAGLLFVSDIDSAKAKQKAKKRLGLA